jgi:hypothetical protein
MGESARRNTAFSKFFFGKYRVTRVIRFSFNSQENITCNARDLRENLVDSRCSDQYQRVVCMIKPSRAFFTCLESSSLLLSVRFYTISHFKLRYKNTIISKCSMLVSQKKSIGSYRVPFVFFFL